MKCGFYNETSLSLDTASNNIAKYFYFESVSFYAPQFAN